MLDVTDRTDRGQWTTDNFDTLQSKKSRDAYIKMGTDLVAFLVGACTGQLGKVQAEVTDEQRGLASQFRERLQDCDDTTVAALQAFLLSFFTHSMKDKSVHTLLPYRFVVLYSFRHDGTILPCNDITQIISKVVYFGRGSIFKCIKATMDADHTGFFL